MSNKNIILSFNLDKASVSNTDKEINKEIEKLNKNSKINLDIGVKNFKEIEDTVNKINTTVKTMNTGIGQTQKLTTSINKDGKIIKNQIENVINFEKIKKEQIKQQNIDLKNQAEITKAIIRNKEQEIIQAQKIRSEKNKQFYSQQETEQLLKQKTLYSDLESSIKKQYTLEEKLIKANAEKSKYLSKELSTQIEIEKSKQKTIKQTISSSNLSNKQKELDIDKKLIDGKNNLAIANAKVSDGLKSNKKVLGSFLNEMKVAIVRTIEWTVAVGGIYAVMNKIKEGISFVSDIDKDLTIISSLTGQTREEVQSLGKEYVALSRDLKINSREIFDNSVALYRQGLSAEQVKERMTEISKASKITGVDVRRVTDFMTAGMNTLNISAKQFNDVLIKASSIAGTSYDEIGEGLSKASASAGSAGVSFEKLTSYITTLSENTRESAQSLGNFTKTVFARFKKVNEVTGELNQEFNQVQKAFESVGIQFTDTAGQIRPVSDLLDDLNLQWKTLEPNVRSYFATQAAGTRQQNRFIALMDNYNRSLEINDELLVSSGITNRQYQAYLEGVEAAQNNVSTSLNELYVKLLESDTIKNFLNSIASFIQYLSTAQEKFGLLKIVLTSLVPILSTILAKTIALKGIKIIKAVQDFIPSLIVLKKKLFDVQTQAEATKAVTTTLSAGFVGVGLAISGVMLIASAFEEAERKKRDNIDKTTTSLYEQVDGWEKLNKSEKDELKTQAELLKIKIGKTSEQLKNEIVDLQEQKKQLTDEIIRDSKGVGKKSYAQNIISEKQYKDVLSNSIDEINKRIEVNQSDQESMKLVNNILGNKIELTIKERKEQKKVYNAYKQYGEALQEARDKINGVSDDIEELTDKEKERQEMMQFSIEQLDTLAQKYPEYSEKVIEYQIKETEAVIIEAQKRLSAMEIESSAIDRVMQKYYGMKGVADDATLNMSRAILNTINSGTFKDVIDTSALDGAKKDLQDLLDLQEKYFGKDKKSSSKTKEATAYYKELAKIAEIENKIAILKTRQSIETDELKKIDLMKDEIEKTKELQDALHILNEARREDKKLLKEDSEEYYKMEDAIAKTSNQWLVLDKTIQDINKTIEDNAKKYLKELKDAYSDVEENIIKILEEQYNKEKDLAKDAYDENLKNLEDVEEKKTQASKTEYEKRKKLLEDEISEVENLIKARIKLLQEGYETEDFNKEIAESEKRQLALKDKINALSLSSGLEERGKVEELKTQLADEEAKKQDLITNRTRDKQIDALEDELDKFSKNKNDKISLLESEYNKSEQLREKDLADEKDKLKKEYDALVENIDKKLTKEALYTEARNLIENKSLTELSIMFRKYINEYDKGFSLLGDSIENNFISKIKKATALMSTLNGMNSSSVNNMSGNPLNMTQSDFNEYVENKRVAEKYGRGTDEFNQAYMNNSLLRKNYGILSDKFSFDDLIKSSSLNIHNINSQTVISKIPPITKSGGMNIGTLLNIEGNVDRNTMPEIKATTDRMTQILNEFSKNGGRLK